MRYYDQFEKYITQIIKKDHPYADDFKINILSDRIIIDFSIDIKEALDRYIVKNIKVKPSKIIYKPLTVNDGLVIDYNYNIDFLFNFIEQKFYIDFIIDGLSKDIKEYISIIITNTYIYVNHIMNKNNSVNLNVVITIPKIPLKTPTYYYNNIILKNLHLNTSSLGGMTKEQIKFTPFVYLRHITFLYSFSLMLDNKKLQNRLNLSKQNINVHSGLAGAYSDREFSIEDSAYHQIQFPGVYTSLITQYDLIKFEPISDDDSITLILSLSLLTQQNWHLNIHDQFGAINNETFSPKNLAKYLYLLGSIYGLKTDEDYTDREVIIHDDIPIELIDCIIVKNDKLKKEIEILMKGFKIPVFLDTRELRKELIFKQFIRDNDDYLNNNLPQLCYTNIVLDYPEESEDVNDYIKDLLVLTHISYQI